MSRRRIDLKKIEAEVREEKAASDHDELRAFCELPPGLTIEPSPFATLKAVVVAYDALEAQVASPPGAGSLRPYLEELTMASATAMDSLDATMAAARALSYGVTVCGCQPLAPPVANRLIDTFTPILHEVDVLLGDSELAEGEEDYPGERLELATAIVSRSPRIPGLWKKEEL